MTFGAKFEVNTVPTGVFPFDATKYGPFVAAVAEEMEALESADSVEPPNVQLAERTLVEIVSNKFLNESARVRAAQLLLDRYDTKVELAQLRKDIEALKETKKLEF